MKTLQEFLTDLGARESGGKYNVINKYGYAGKYQMGEMALTDAGYYTKPSKKYNNDWSGKFIGKDGVNSIQDFLKNPQETYRKYREHFHKYPEWIRPSPSERTYTPEYSVPDPSDPKDFRFL